MKMQHMLQKNVDLVSLILLESAYSVDIVHMNDMEDKVDMGDRGDREDSHVSISRLPLISERNMQ